MSKDGAMGKKRASRVEKNNEITGRGRMVRGLLYVLPVVLYFSYWPVIGLGKDATMNFELSLPLVWLVIFDVVMLVILTKEKKWGGLIKQWRWMLLPIWLTMTVFWSLNFTRGILTVGIVWLIYLAGFGMWEMREVWRQEKNKRRWWKIFFGAAMVAVIWCGVQCVMDLMGVGQDVTLMCDGCKYEMFGFPHPNGLAIEPQFMGNLLIAPAIMAGYFWITKKTHGWVFLVLGAGVFLTFSRGAIYAFVIGMIIMVMWMGLREKKWKQGMMAMGIMVMAFLLTLCGQGVMAEMSRTDDTFQTGVAKVINHLSLGVIKMPDGKMDNLEGETVEKVVMDGTIEEKVGREWNVAEMGQEGEMDDEGVEGMSDKSAQGIIEQEKKKSAFDGYVAESTDTRLRLTNAAVTIWRQDFMTVMAGVGLGGAGQALYNNGLSPAPKEIVQNEYASLLLETGVVGIILLLCTVYLIVKSLWGETGVVIVVVISYGVTLLFFSGVANALQVYLLPTILALVLTKSSRCAIIRR